MAWDTETTRAKLLEAGARQFAENGFAGARMAAIGADAGVNKERVYHYFGDKDGLFAAVLAGELGGLFDVVIDWDVEHTDTDRHARAHFIGDFAGRLFDRCLDRPALPRLLAWESLELPHATAVESRTPMCTRNRSSIGAVLGITDAAAGHLLFSVISLVVGWWTVAALREPISVDDHDVATRRSMIVIQSSGMASAMMDAAVADSR